MKALKLNGFLAILQNNQEQNIVDINLVLLDKNVDVSTPEKLDSYAQSLIDNKNEIMGFENKLAFETYKVFIMESVEDNLPKGLTVNEDHTLIQYHYNSKLNELKLISKIQELTNLFWGGYKLTFNVIDATMSDIQSLKNENIIDVEEIDNSIHVKVKPSVDTIKDMYARGEFFLMYDEYVEVGIPFKISLKDFTLHLNTYC